MKKLQLLLFLFTTFFLNSSFAESPTQLHVGVYVRSISIDTKKQQATIDFYYWYRFAVPKNPGELKDYYALEITNGDLIFNEKQEHKTIGNLCYASGHMKGKFHFLDDYENYPFDKLKLMIQFEHPLFEASEMVITPDVSSYQKCSIDSKLWGLSRELNADGLLIEKSNFIQGEKTYETDFGDPEITQPSSTYSTLTYCIHVSRDFVPYVLKFMLPLVIIVSLAYLVFYIPADALDLAAGLTVTSLLAGIAFQWTISDGMPEVGYLTCVDKIFYLSYLCIMISMVQTVWTYHLEKNGNHKLSDFLELSGRWAFPLAFWGGSLYFMLSSYL